MFLLYGYLTSTGKQNMTFMHSQGCIVGITVETVLSIFNHIFPPITDSQRPTPSVRPPIKKEMCVFKTWYWYYWLQQTQRNTEEIQQDGNQKRLCSTGKLSSDKRNTAGSPPNNHRKRLTETRRTEQLLVRDRRLRKPSGFRQQSGRNCCPRGSRELETLY